MQRDMQIAVHWSAQVSAKFPDLTICMGIINGLRIEKDNQRLRELKKAVYSEVRAKYNIETLRDNAVVRAYRDFYWKLDIDPTKTRPSGEALLRRVLHGNELPNISTAVDAYNLASLKTIIPISGFDRNRLNPPLCVRFATSNETFIGIGMDKPITLTEKIMVLADEKQILCVYPYRDLDFTKISEQTRDAVVIGYGAPNVTEQRLKQSVETTLSYIRQVADGEVEIISVLSANPK
jgi:DNA/RNA-binding domain of Phe-tRNA-synthetase-like protein